jgi:primosomal protein N' (replication factor Y)
MFPNSVIYEATQEKKPAVPDRANQIVVATPGSAPRLLSGYSGLLILDPDVWLSAQNLQAEQHAVRDWCEAMELLGLEGRAVISGLGEKLGKPIALWQHKEIARAAYLDAKQLRLPPAVRIVRVTGNAKQLQSASAAILENGGEQLKSDGKSAIYRFDYSKGSEISRELRAIATSAKAVSRGDKNVRGFSVVMDDLESI